MVGVALAVLSATALLVALAFVCLCVAILCSLFENALLHHSHAQLMTLARRQGRLEAITAALEDEDDLLFASKLGRGLAQIVAIAAAVVCLVHAGPGAFGAAAWALGLSLLYLVAAVAGPYLLGRGAGHLILLRGLVGYRRVMSPLRRPAAFLRRLAARATGAQVIPDPAEEISDELASVLEEGTREGTLAPVEKEMIEGVMDLREVTAEHVMTPRTELVCVRADASAAEAIERAKERGLSRLPVYRDTPDDILGVLYVKDLLEPLARGKMPAVKTIMRHPFFVPESKNVGDLLAEMQASHIHLAIVLDEYGGTSGVVSIEDILEEIVGEIADEHERATPSDVIKMGENAATVEGRAHIDDLNAALDLEIPENEEYETVGGLLFSAMGRVPEAGEIHEIDGVRFSILDADERRIHRVKVVVKRETREGR